jgi:hypothetical protein
VNADLTPALIAAGGGSVLMTGIWAHERRRDAAMRASRVRVNVRFPVGLDPLAAFAVLDGLSGLPLGAELVVEVAASEDRIAHYLWVPTGVRASVESTLVGVVPSARVTKAPLSESLGATLALKLFVPSPSVLHPDNAVAASRTLLAGMTSLRAGEQVVVRWALRAGGARRLPSREPESRSAKELDRAWRRKTVLPGLRVSGLVLVRAASISRARVLVAHIESLVRSRRGLTGEVRITTERGRRGLASLPKTTRSSGWLSSAELLGLIGWPLGPDMPLGVEVGAARQLLTARHVPREGRQLLIGRDSRGERSVALSAEAARHHLAIVGPSGVGKSALVARCVLSDISQGFGGVVIDPKGPDLINTILARVPAADAHRVVVLDPGDWRPVPGVGVLAGGDPDLRAEVLTGVLKAIFADVWGVRSDYYGRLAIRTLAEVPGATLADMGRLFYEPAYRRASVTRLRDPFLVAAWQGYEELSQAARVERVQAPMARVMALLNLPRVRSVLASPEPKLDIGRLLAQRQWLLVSLSPGQLGEAAASFVGAALLYVVWSAIEARVALSPERRHPVSLYIDELATLTGGLPFGFELLAERARGLGAALTVAFQTVGRIPEPTRSSLLGNVASLVSFRAAAEEAPRLSRHLPGLSADDLIALGRFEVAARVGTGEGSAVSVVTGRTEPLPPETGMAEVIRERSAQAYGSQPVPPERPVAKGEVPVGEASVGQKRRQR